MQTDVHEKSILVRSSLKELFYACTDSQNSLLTITRVKNIFANGKHFKIGN